MRNPDHSLKKSLKPVHVGALALGAVIGWGNFILPEVTFLPRSGVLGSSLGFIISGILISFIVVAYGYMIERVPVAGGEFSYGYAGFGTKGGFVCGWAILLGYIAITCANLMGIALVFRALAPGLLTRGELYVVAGWPVYMGELLFLIAIILLFTYTNYRGIEFAGSVQVILAVALTLGILILVFGSVSAEGSTLSNLQPVLPKNVSLFGGIVGIVAISPWLFIGFDTVPQFTEELNFSASKTTGLMLFSVLVGALLYAATTYSVAVFAPFDQLIVTLKENNAPFATAYISEVLFGRIGPIILGIAMLGAVLSGVNAFIIASSRLLLAMGRGKLLPSSFAKVHPVYQTPSAALLFVCFFAITSIFFGRAVVVWLVDMSSVGTALAYFITCMVAIKVMKREKNQKGVVVATIAAAVSMMCFLLLIVPGSPAFIAKEPWIALAAYIVLGILFFIVAYPNTKTITQKEMNQNILGNEINPVTGN